MKLVFPGGEHPQVLLGLGVNRVGSDPECQVVLDRPGVEPRLCQLHVTGQGVMLDVPPGASIRVNGREVDGLITLRPGDSVDLGGIEARLAGLGAVAIPSGEALDTAMPANDEDDLRATTVRQVVPDFVLVGVAGAVFGRHVPVNGTVTFGRAPECTVSVDESGLSRLHGRLQTGDGALLFEDMGSSNGSFVNGRRVLRAEVKAGDEISMDTLRFRVVSNMRMETPPAQQRKPAATRWWWLGLAVLAVAVCVGIWAGVTGQLG